MAKSRICSIPDCGNPFFSQNLCSKHYKRLKRNGDPLAFAPKRKRAICTIPECGKPVVGRGWCNAHYLRWMNHGDPLGGGTSLGLPQRFIDEVVLSYQGDDCLIWPYCRNSHGYAKIDNERSRNLTRFVHRRVCEIVYGPPPAPKDHAAHNCGRGQDGCVNPRHLAWKTHKENMADKRIHGTMPEGDRSSRGKLTSDDVRQIRYLRDKVSYRVIASIFGVGKSAILAIYSGKTWRCLP